MKNFRLFVASTLAALALSEAALWLLTPLPVNGWSNRVTDSVLSYRLDPDFREVDSRGFRNSPGSSLRVVAIGDSHTFGVNAKAHESWPALLGIYNMGVGSYSIYQYSVLAEQAAAWGSEYVILGLFPANDLQGHRGCEVLSQPSWRPRIRRDSLFQCEPRPDTITPPLYWWIANWTALGNLVDRTVITPLVAPPPVIEIGGMTIPRANVVEHGRATRLDNELNAGHFDNSLKLLRRMSEQVSLAVLIIPSKERVLAKWSDPGPEVAEVVAQEERLTRLWTQHLEALGVPVVDATRHMVDVVRRDSEAGRLTYPELDGHPFPHGYEAYARAARELLPRPSVGEEREHGLPDR